MIHLQPKVLANINPEVLITALLTMGFFNKGFALLKDQNFIRSFLTIVKTILALTIYNNAKPLNKGVNVGGHCPTRDLFVYRQAYTMVWCCVRCLMRN